MSSNRYVIICESRTGSTALGSALAMHPRVCAHGEVLQPRQSNPEKMDSIIEFAGLNYNRPKPIISILRQKLIDDPLSYVKDYVLVADGNHDVVGFKFKYEELSCGMFDTVVDYIRQDKQIKIIHLTRDNLWHRYKSMYIAVNVTKVYNSNKESLVVKCDKKNYVSPQTVHDAFEKSERWKQKYSDMFSQHQVFDLEYSQLVQQPQETFSEVCNFLGTSTFQWKPETKKITAVQDDEIFENMSEIREYFETTKYKYMFND